jgi:hypothetical protein
VNVELNGEISIGKTDERKTPIQVKFSLMINVTYNETKADYNIYGLAETQLLQIMKTMKSNVLSGVLQIAGYNLEVYSFEHILLNVVCPAGEYQNEHETGSCNKCPEGTSTKQNNSKSKSECIGKKFQII